MSDEAPTGTLRVPPIGSTSSRTFLQLWPSETKFGHLIINYDTAGTVVENHVLTLVKRQQARSLTADKNERLRRKPVEPR